VPELHFTPKISQKLLNIERVAILDAYQKTGLGKMLMDYIVNFCKSERAKEAHLNSQLHAKDFYIKCGFKPYGEIFMDAGIEHIAMFRDL